MSKKKIKPSKMLQQHDIDIISKIIRESVDRMKVTYGEDKFCEHVAIAMELRFENPLVPGKIATQYMLLGEDDQYKNLACYLIYSLGMINAKSPEDIEPSLKRAANELKKLVLKYNKDNPYIDE